MKLKDKGKVVPVLN